VCGVCVGVYGVYVVCVLVYVCGVCIGVCVGVFGLNLKPQAPSVHHFKGEIMKGLCFQVECRPKHKS